jgi:hypothetical protein
VRYLLAFAFAGFVLTGAESFLRDDSLVTSVEKEIRGIQPTREERRFDEIGWAPNIREAEAGAKKASRAVFLFTYDGNIEQGRC